MLNIQLLVIQLIPDFLIFSAVVIMGHWIWLFGIKKGGPANLSPSTMGNKMVSKPIDATKAAQFIPKSSNSSLPFKTDEPPNQAGVGSGKPSEEEDKCEPADERYQSPSPQTQAGHPTESPLTLKYAGLSVTELVRAHQEGKLTQEEIREWDELAALTIVNQQQHAHSIDALKGLFNTQSGTNPLIPFLS